MGRDVRQPQAAQWWECKGTRVRIIGVKSDGQIVYELSDESVGVMSVNVADSWQHLPECTGWDWKPEVFPQYWTAINSLQFAYCLRTAPDKYVMITRDGTAAPENNWYPDTNRDREQITREQAEAMLDKDDITSATMTQEDAQKVLDVMNEDPMAPGDGYRIVGDDEASHPVAQPKPAPAPAARSTRNWRSWGATLPPSARWKCA